MNDEPRNTDGQGQGPSKPKEWMPPGRFRSALNTARAFWPVIVAVIVASFGGTGIAIVVTDDDPSTPDKPLIVIKTPTITSATANAAPGDGLPAVQVKAPAPLVEKVEASEDHAHLASPPTAAMAEPVRQAIAADTSKPLPTGGAVQGFAGCTTRILPANYSSRPGVRPVWQVDHYTVSHNVAGWADVYAIWNLFANPGRQASSNFIIDAEGHCLYAVPIEAKAWTQAGGNPWSISYEIVAYGNETALLGPAGWAKLRSVQHQVAYRTGIPLRRGSVGGGCVPGRPGIVQHKDFGLCGGGHVDITPFSIDQAVRMVTGPTTSLTKRERHLARGLAHPKGSGHSKRYWCRETRRARGRIFRAARPPAPPKTGFGRYHRSERQTELGKAIKKAGCR